MRFVKAFLGLFTIRFWLIYRIFQKILIFARAYFSSKIRLIKRGFLDLILLALTSILVFWDLLVFLASRFNKLDFRVKSFFTVLFLVSVFSILNFDQIPASLIASKPLGGEIIEVVSSPFQVKDSSFLSLESALAAASEPALVDLESGAFQDDLIASGDSLLPNSNPVTEPTPLSKPRPAPSRPSYVFGLDLQGYFIFPTLGFNRGRAHYYNAADISGGDSCLADAIPVYAAASGLVISTQATESSSRYVNGGYGNNIIILHPNGVLTRYAHLKAILIGNNSYVNQGSLIAYMGGYPGLAGAGNSTGCHLHFEVRGGRNPFISY